MWGFIALLIVVALVGGCAIAFGHNSRVDVTLDRRIEVDPSISVEAKGDVETNPKEKRK